MKTARDEMPDPLEAELSNNPSSAAEFENAHGESLATVLDLNTWLAGDDLAVAYSRLQQEVAEAVTREADRQKIVRQIIFDRLQQVPGAPHNAGVYQAKAEDMERVHKGLLFNGGVEACGGKSIMHDTLALTVTQIGVCLVSYNGQQGAWAHRLFRRDLRTKLADPIEEVLAVLDQRERRDGLGWSADNLSELARRGIRVYAERAILKDKSTAAWRMGSGSPAPFELLTGLWASQADRIKVSLDLIGWYVAYKRFVFVPDLMRQRHWLTLGNALGTLQFAIIQTLEPEIRKMIDSGGYRDVGRVRPALEKFCREVAPQIVVGLFRVWQDAPPYLFYAHVDCAEVAAHIAMADSLLQAHRGFPLLIDLADTVCRTTFGPEAFMPSMQMAYTEAGQPFSYLDKRETRS